MNSLTQSQAFDLNNYSKENLKALTSSDYVELFFDKHKEKLKKWINMNILEDATRLVEHLFDIHEITDDDIINLYPVIESDDDSDDEYFNSKLEIVQWFIVTEKAYQLLLKCNYPVLWFKGIHLWGRICFGQDIVYDFNYRPEHIAILLGKIVDIE